MFNLIAIIISAYAVVSSSAQENLRGENDETNVEYRELQTATQVNAAKAAIFVAGSAITQPLTSYTKIIVGPGTI